MNEFKAPSGDVYEFRFLTYGEKMDLAQKKALGRKIKITGNRNRTKSEEVDMDMDMSVIVEIQREIVYKTMIKASWLKQGQKISKELIDENVKGVDAEAINGFVEKINYPASDVVEKSSGQ
jgi:hypothetical protein